MQVSVLFFADRGVGSAADQYALVLDAARVADRGGLDAVWVPERHFHAFGGAFPNAAVVAAAVASVTDRVRIRAGSVVLPLHNPVRVAEEWACVDQLSGGRVDIAFATGWNPNDFVLAPDAFAERRASTLADLRTVCDLWAGKPLELRNGSGDTVPIVTYPRPVQPVLEAWLTCSGADHGFRNAGRTGLNVLTALLHQTIDELRGKLDIYREAREEAGLTPWGGKVTLMLHTYLARSVNEARRIVREPFLEYLGSSADLWGVSLPSLARMTPRKRDLVLEMAFERYFTRAGLFGTTESVRSSVEVLAGMGVTEIACLVDFGLPNDVVLEGLERVVALAATLHEAAPIEGQGNVGAD
jgi:natural product biosynthesis luciferase-like monooxygenase protein